MVRHQVNPETEYAFLHQLFGGNQEAINLFMTMAAVSQTMDDLIDKDKEVPDTQIAETFYQAICVLPTIKLYRDNISDIVPYMFGVFSDYMASVELEKGDDHDKNMAFMLRDSLSGFATLIYALLNGRAAAFEKSAEIRRFFHDETLEEYKKDLPKMMTETEVTEQ